MEIHKEQGRTLKHGNTLRTRSDNKTLNYSKDNSDTETWKCIKDKIKHLKHGNTSRTADTGT
jgi:hypothetical protein